jgi:hypothetical protein
LPFQSNIKIEAFVNALKGGAEIVPIVVFDDIPIQWLNTFEYCFIVALRKYFGLISYLSVSFAGYLTKRFGDAAELWNISAGSIQPDDKLFGKDPVKQIEFGVLLALLAHRNVITVEIEEEEDAPDNQDIGTDNDVDMSGDD